MRKRVEGLRLEETGQSWQKSRFKVTSPLSVCVRVSAPVRMYWSCGCNYECVKSFLWSFLSRSHMWWHSLSTELPLIRLLRPDTLSEEHSLDFNGRARPFSPKQLALAWGVCVCHYDVYSVVWTQEARIYNISSFHYAQIEPRRFRCWVRRPASKHMDLFMFLCLSPLTGGGQQLTNTASFEAIKARESCVVFIFP